MPGAVFACLEYIRKQNKTPCPHGPYVMMMMMTILKMVPALWDLKIYWEK